MGATMTPVFVRALENSEPRKERIKSTKPTPEALRIKRSRLKKNAMTIIGLHRSRTRFATITTIPVVLDKKDFLYRMENARKALKKAGYEIKYTGGIERQDGKRRADKKGRMSWHLHCVAYRIGGVLLKNGKPDWNYEKMNAIMEHYGLHIHGDKIERSKTATLSKYMTTIDAALVAAYTAKLENPAEDYFYTLTSKHCDIPKKKRYDEQQAREFIEFGKFRKKEFVKKDGQEIKYFHSDYEGFLKMDYEGWENGE